ncbi:hypothetical protein ALC53_05063 [Atta colombica]|uniref:Uncharacterized protein n=1 Tax=Atta colombica TaxID=520822 RepID=A0A151I540_9HYME|nr:hypothetical protein ALC53_05063 [Atta colombica]
MSRLRITREPWGRTNANREALCFVLWLLTNRGGRNGNLCSNLCSVKRTHESDVSFNLKDSNWVSVPGGRTLTPDVPVHPYALSVMELNPSDQGEGEMQPRESLQ